MTERWAMDFDDWLALVEHSPDPRVRMRAAIEEAKASPLEPNYDELWPQGVRRQCDTCGREYVEHARRRVCRSCRGKVVQ